MRDLWLTIQTESISRERHLDRIPPNQSTIRVNRDAIENEENNRGTGDADLHDSPRPKFPLFNFYLGSFTERLDSNFSMINGYSNEFFCHSLSKGLKYSPVPLDLPERYIVPRPLLFWIPCIPISTVYP